MASALTSTLTLLALIAATSANAGLIPGGGPTKSDCYLELDVAGIENGTPRVEKNKIVLCTDGEACDTGACGDSSCTVSIAACINQSDPTLACTPPAGLQKVSIKKKLDVQTPQALEGAKCLSPLSLTIPVNFKKGNFKPKKSQVTLKGVGKGLKGTKPRTDKDTWIIRCLPRTVECPPPTTTTTTTTTTSTTTPTTLPRVCGNNVVEEGEACDPPGSRPCPSSPSGAILCTADCSTLDFSQCPGAFTLDFTNGAPTGFCGETRDAANAKIKDLGCGGLNIGGGNSGLNEGPTPDGARNRYNAFCNDTECQLQPYLPKPAANSVDPDCTDTGCNFGTPLQIPNAALPALGVCVLNTFSEPASGTLTRATGEANLSISLSSKTFVTGDILCPKCLVTGTPTPENPGTGTCDSGQNEGQACTSTNSIGLTRDCPPLEVLALPAPIPVVLTPLRTVEVTRSTTDGGFCPDQGTNAGNPSMKLGCFGSDLCRSIIERGVAAGPVTPNTPAPVTLASVFCIPATGNGAVDGSSDLPGPGAVSLPGTFLLSPQ